MDQEIGQLVAPELKIAEASNVLIPEALKEVVELLLDHPETDRLLTAIRHYALAMRNWRPGYELAALSSLFAGMEALTTLIVAEELSKRGNVSRADLAREWAVEVRDLGSEARRRILFQGDTQTHDDAAKARHGYVHGFLTFETAGALATASGDKTASYLRIGILRLLGIRDDTAEALASKCGTPPISGTFAGVTGTLNEPTTIEGAASMNFRLLTEDDRRPKSVQVDEANGTYTMEMASNMTVRAAGMKVSGSLYTRGTNMANVPAVTATRRGETGEWTSVTQS